MKNSLCHRIAALLGVVMTLATFASSARALDWNPQTQGDFVFALAQGEDGFWVGTEEKGVWRRDAAGNWRNFTRADGLGDDCALCITRRGSQLWVGHGSGGLSVWDGQNWTNVGVEDGLPSERVTTLSVGSDGAVWVGTENGLLRWSDENGWFTPESPLCQRSIAGLASVGNLIVAATSCEGLLLSRDGGKSWEEVRGPQIQPNTPSGEGLPSDVLNDVKIDALGQIWVASDTGFARSDDGGKTWFYVRGSDWKANVEGSTRGLKAQNAALDVDLAAEDWLQTLAPTRDGKIWLGFRQKGVELRDCKSGETLFSSVDDRSAVSWPSGDWVRSILPLAGDRALAARYGGGVAGLLKGDFPAFQGEITGAKLRVPTPLPTLDAAQLKLLIEAKSALKEARPTGSGAWESLDFRTQGDWVGRYGGVSGNPGRDSYNRWGGGIDVSIGPHIVPGGVGPYSYWAAAGPGERSALYFPAHGERRRSELNDGTFDKISYPMTWEGPDLWVLAKVDVGAQRLAIYFVNSDGHGSDFNRFRDYIVSLRAYTPKIKDAEQAPDLARGRLRDAWHGGYARFSVVGPAKFWIKIARHRSFVTKTNGIFLDYLTGAAPADDATAQVMDKLPTALMGDVLYTTQNTPPAEAAENEIVSAARGAWRALDEAATRLGGLEGRWQTRLQIYRAAKAAGAPEKLLENSRWKLTLWQESDREAFNATMREARTSELAKQAAAKTKTAEQQAAIARDFKAAMDREKADAAAKNGAP